MRSVTYSAVLFSILLIFGCGDGVGGVNSPAFLQLRGPLDCAYAEGVDDSCTLRRLPLIGMDSPNPTRDEVLARTDVSHEWMRTRFRAALEELPDDLIGLFRAVTAVVISRDIRPSFYTTRTGAIYIDPAYLWVTVEEKRTISTDPDYRSEFGNRLRFVALWRYVIGSQSAYSRGSLTDDNPREPADIVLPLARLLYHELAHANDFFSADRHSELNRDTKIVESTQRDTWINTQLSEEYPLESEELRAMGRVLYFGEDPSSEQLEITAADMGALFENDMANDNYAYASNAEDVAMLFEEVMMRYHYGIDRVLAFVDASEEIENCNDYIVQWGRRGRAGAEALRGRTELILRRILNVSDVSEYMDKLPPALPLNPGDGFCESIENVTRPASGGEGIRLPAGDVDSDSFDLLESQEFERMPIVPELN